MPEVKFHFLILLLVNDKITTELSYRKLLFTVYDLRLDWLGT